MEKGMMKWDLERLTLEIRNVDERRCGLDERLKYLNEINNDVHELLISNWGFNIPKLKFKAPVGRWSADIIGSEIEATQTWRNDVGRLLTAMRRREKELKNL
jgi:hypothetical protein